MTDVSTHAPEKGATDEYNRRLRRQLVSTHAPEKGATVPPSTTVTTE